MSVAARRCAGPPSCTPGEISNLYLRRLGQSLYLAIEHRAAPSVDRMQLSHCTSPPALALAVVDEHTAEPVPQASAQQRLEQILAQATTPLTQRQLRDAARLRASNVSQALADLVATGRVRRTTDGYCSNLMRAPDRVSLSRL